MTVKELFTLGTLMTVKKSSSTEVDTAAVSFNASSITNSVKFKTQRSNSTRSLTLLALLITARVRSTQLKYTHYTRVRERRHINNYNEMKAYGRKRI